MSDPSKPVDSPLKNQSGAESPTTVKPYEMDDDDVQETGMLGNDATTQSRHATVEDAPPAKPPRPLSPQQQAENTLKEAFPSIDAAVVKAVLRASGGRVEPAFNALLGMSDPDAVREPSPPPQPPRPQVQAQPQAQPRQHIGSTPLSQVEADEQYARQLAEHYGGGWGEGPRNSSRGPQPQRQQGNFRAATSPEKEERNFIDDDLPVIKETLKKGFLDTQRTVNGWISNLKKRIDGEDEDGNPLQQGYQSGPSSQYRSRRSGEGRQSGDYGRYDADPHILADDFAGIQMNPDGTPARRSTRPLANPDLFKPTPAVPRGDGRKVAFQGGPPEEIDLYQSSPKMAPVKDTPPPSGKQSKWQPLSTVDPSPIGHEDNDPFSLGDSEDEKESKDRVGGKEVKQDDAERLKKAAAEAMSGNIGDSSGGRILEPTETSGTKNKIAEEKLGGKS